MKTAIQTNVWSDAIHRAGIQTIFEAIAAAGYDGFEIGAHRVNLEQPQVFRQMADDCGLQIAGIHTHGDLYNLEAVQAEAMPRIRQAARFAAEAGSPYLLISGKPKAGKDQTDLNHQAQALQAIGRICREAGVHLLYHNHYWEIEHNAADLQHIVDHTGPDEVSLALDVGWVHRAGGSPVQVAQRFLPRIRYFHFKDFRVKDFQNDTWTELGAGYVDFPGVMAVIAGGDYWITVERDETLENATESAQISAAYLQRLLA